MFVGHYGVSFVIKKADPSIPLWVLFIAVQWLDVLWAPFVMLGVQAYVFFGPPPVSSRAAASTALGAYVIFALIIWFLVDRRAIARAA